MPASTTKLEKRLPAPPPYSSKIIKAGALIGDTKTLLAHWDVDASVDENIKRVQRDNIFGKASRSRVEAILAILRQRYLTEDSVTKALVTLVRKKFPSAALERLLYFHSARADRLLSDAVTEILVPMHARGMAEAQKAGIAHAQTHDDGTKYRGRKPTFTLEQFTIVRELLNRGTAISAIAKTTGVKRQSIYRIRSDPERQHSALRAWYATEHANPQ